MELCKPISHECDPTSSHVAAEQHTGSGRRNRNAQLVLDLVWLCGGGLTCCEMWDRASLDTREQLKEMQEIRRRCSDMLGVHVKQGPARKCSIKGTKQVVWYPIETAVPLFG